MTELLYLPRIDDAYRTQFTGRITALPPGAVVLDRTLFYPTGGGQPSDLGTLVLPDGSTLAVEDVARSGVAVLHRTGRRGNGSGLALGAEVHGTIDWERRHRHMRLHTFQHLLSARIFALHGRRTRRAQLAGHGGYLDVEGPWPDGAAGPVIEDVRAYLARDHPVRITWLSRADYDRQPGDRSGLVPLPPQVDPVRLVEIEAADRCPCGGTHVARLGEIGAFQVGSPTPLPGGGARVTFTLTGGAPPTPRA